MAAPTRNITVLVRYPATSAGANKPVAAGTHPLVVVGHGAAGSGADSTNLHNFLAADGYIVAGPSFGNIVSKLAQGAGEVSATITYLINLKTGVLANKTDGTRVGYAGTSMGGMIGYALKRPATADPRIRAFALRAASAGGTETLVVGPALLAMHGNADKTVSFSSGQSAYSRSVSPKAFITLAGVGHDLAVSGPYYTDGLKGFFARYLRDDANGLTRLNAAVAATSNASMTSSWGTTPTPTPTPSPILHRARALTEPESVTEPKPSPSPSLTEPEPVTEPESFPSPSPHRARALHRARAQPEPEPEPDSQPVTVTETITEPVPSPARARRLHRARAFT